MEEHSNLDQVSSAPHLLKGDAGRVEPAGRVTSERKGRSVDSKFLAGSGDPKRGDSGGQEKVKDYSLSEQRKAGVGGVNMDTGVDVSEFSSGEMQAIVAEEKALQEVVKSRVEELAVAQQARERMSTIFGVEEIKMMAERQRARTTYRNELEHAASPLLPKAWLGLIEDRLARWKESHISWKKMSHPPSPKIATSPQDYRTGKATHGKHQPLTKGQLLAASSKGTALEDVVQVVVYRSRHVIELSSLQQCPKLRSVTFVGCGLESVTDIVQDCCPQLMELNLPVSLYMGT